MYERVSSILQLQNMELELDMLRTKSLKKSSKDMDGNDNTEIIRKLRQELKKVTEELARSKEKLGISRLSNLNRLVEVAANREKVRNLEDDLEEVRLICRVQCCGILALLDQAYFILRVMDFVFFCSLKRGYREKAKGTKTRLMTRSAKSRRTKLRGSV